MFEHILSVSLTISIDRKLYTLRCERVQFQKHTISRPTHHALQEYLTKYLDRSQHYGCGLPASSCVAKCRSGRSSGSILFSPLLLDARRRLQQGQARSRTNAATASWTRSGSRSFLVPSLLLDAWPGMRLATLRCDILPASPRCYMRTQLIEHIKGQQPKAQSFVNVTLYMADCLIQHLNSYHTVVN